MSEHYSITKGDKTLSNSYNEEAYNLFCDGTIYIVNAYLSTVPILVSGLNATNKTPMFEMPLIYVFGVLGFGVGAP